MPPFSLATCCGKSPQKLHRIFRCVSSNFPLRAESLVVKRPIHFVKHGGRGKVACRAGNSLLLFFYYELGSCLQAGETNSARPGYYLWGARQGIAFTRRGEDRGQSFGGDPFRKRNTVASRRGRPREVVDSGTVCLPAEKTPGKRRREDRGASGGFCEARVGAEGPEGRGEEEGSPQEKEAALICTSCSTESGSPSKSGLA